MSVRIVGFIKIERGTCDRITAALMTLAQVIKVDSTAGEYDLIVELAGQTPSELSQALMAIDQVPGVLDMRSHFVMASWEK